MRAILSCLVLIGSISHVSADQESAYAALESAAADVTAADGKYTEASTAVTTTTARKASLEQRYAAVMARMPINSRNLFAGYMADGNASLGTAVNNKALSADYRNTAYEKFYLASDEYADGNYAFSEQLSNLSSVASSYCSAWARQGIENCRIANSKYLLADVLLKVFE